MSKIIIAAALVALGAPALAQQPALSTGKPITRAAISASLSADHKKLDANADGSLSKAELEAGQSAQQSAIQSALAKRRAAAFAKLDSDKNGQLSLAEFNAGVAGPPPRKADGAVLLQRLDSNKDSKISLPEFSARLLANFDRVDANKDGTLSLDEQKKAMAAGRR